jgi:hypothetical protein
VEAFAEGSNAVQDGWFSQYFFILKPAIWMKRSSLIFIYFHVYVID